MMDCQTDGEGGEKTTFQVHNNGPNIRGRGCGFTVCGLAVARPNLKSHVSMTRKLGKLASPSPDLEYAKRRLLRGSGELGIDYQICSPVKIAGLSSSPKAFANDSKHLQRITRPPERIAPIRTLNRSNMAFAPQRSRSSHRRTPISSFWCVQTSP